MRRSVTIFLVVNLLVVAYLISSVWTLLSLLVVDGSSDAITRAELPGVDESLLHRKEIIPRIIHQTYVNESIPAHWETARQSCLELHKEEDGWKYILWTDRKSRDFIAQEYPWFLETWDGYSYPIQRADAIRYFVLAHFGGIYVDLDDGCNRKLDPLLVYPAWLRRTVPTGISNDAMGSVPHHPFFLRVIYALSHYDKSWLMPYITVMASTGPLFLSIIWRHYNTDLGASPIFGMTRSFGRMGGGHIIRHHKSGLGPMEHEMEAVRILMPSEYAGNRWSFFTHHLGNSWHQTDVKFVFWMRDNWVFLLLLGFSIAGFVFFTAWSLYRRALRARSTGASAISTFSISLRKHFPFLVDGNDGYELLPSRGRERERRHPV